MSEQTTAALILGARHRGLLDYADDCREFALAADSEAQCAWFLEEALAAEAAAFELRRDDASRAAA